MNEWKKGKNENQAKDVRKTEERQQVRKEDTLERMKENWKINN